MSGFWTVMQQILEKGVASVSTSTVTLDGEQEPAHVQELRSEMHMETSARSRPADQMARIRSEIFMIAPHHSRYEGICYDEANCDWVMIPKYPLPEKWRERWCKLLIVFSDYPATPPVGFYLNRQFTLKSGGTDSHLIGRGLHGAPDLLRQGWFWYCTHLKDRSEGGWRPSARYDQPDNLFTFLSLVREVLTND